MGAQAIKPGSPLKGATFAKLYSDPGLQVMYGLACLSDAIKKQSVTLNKYEIELEILYKAQKSAKQSNQVLWGGKYWTNDKENEEIEKKRETLETTVFEKRKTFLLARISSQQKKLDKLQIRKERLGKKRLE